MLQPVGQPETRTTRGMAILQLSLLNRPRSKFDVITGRVNVLERRNMCQSEANASQEHVLTQDAIDIVHTLAR